MSILNETARQVKNRLALEYDTVTMKRLVIGAFSLF